MPGPNPNMPERLKAFTHVHEMPWHWALTDHTYLASHDGKTWQGGLMIDERRGVSYPDGVQSPDGMIYLIYDFDRHGAKQILMATFTEDDVVQGKCVSDAARMRVVVNQATGVKPD